ncbi:hypothetical protein EB169_10245, partial [archaeon]|nr:hypothetical protein [archaeon]
DIDLSSRDPEVLKSHILYCYTFFGASDDIRELGYYAYKDYTKSYDATLIKWHCGLGGKSGYSNNFRKLVEAEVYLPIINETKKVSKLSTMPLRSSFTYDIETNKNTGFNQYLSSLSITIEEVEGGYITIFPGGPYFEGKEILLVFNAESVSFVNWEVKDVSGNNVPVNNDKIIMPETSITVKAITS